MHVETRASEGEQSVFSTGLPGLDGILHGIMPGDNVVWQVESVEDYLPFVKPFRDKVRLSGKKLVYFRFAKHQALLPPDSTVQIHRLRPEDGFEQFITGIHDVIGSLGDKACYIFDSHSDLAIDNFSERMIGNFFMLTCPYILRLESFGYFMVQRYYHSHHAALPIASTTQLLLDVYSHQGRTYVHPQKVYGRYSPTMFMLHLWEKDKFIPVTDSTTISSVVTSGPWHGLQSASYRMVGMWDRRFIEAEDVLDSFQHGECSQATADRVFHRQLTQLVSRDERVLALARQYFTLADLIHIWKRTIGSGMIGGKSVGMLLARAILRASGKRWNEVLETHDSFFIGSDIFYSYLVENDCWPIRQKQKSPKTFMDGAEEGRKRILAGRFPDYIVQRFADMLDYFGQCPIIVRSSSLLEDNFSNAFSGKYDSMFCVNRGTHEERLESFLAAVKQVYASTMSREALAYRAKRNVLDRDEQMALLVQRVSGERYGQLFFPHLAGVGVSCNSYVWSDGIDPAAGLLRLVFGLGTRAVDRHDDDYTRLVALNAPRKRPEGDAEEIRRYTQKKVDLLDLEQNKFRSAYFTDIIKESPGLAVDFFSLPDTTTRPTAGEAYNTIAFENIFDNTRFVNDMRNMLSLLREKYECHIDVEFTANFRADGAYKINLLQCRPLQVKREISGGDAIPQVEKANLLLQAHGGIIGPGRVISVDWLIYVVPSVYAGLAEQDRHEVARLVGRLAHHPAIRQNGNIMLLGPGRWGTRMPSLGVPVSFSEINTVSVICEIARMHEQLMPDLSLGTHYFNDMVEMDMLYLGFSPNAEGNVLNEQILQAMPNRMGEMAPETGNPANAIRIVSSADLGEGAGMRLHADAIKQVAVLYLAHA